jgi:putative hemolysin
MSNRANAISAMRVVSGGLSFAGAKTINSVRFAIEKIDSELKLHHYKIRNFEPKVEISIERGNYLVKTAENGVELEQCLKLRFDVFHREYMFKSNLTGVDVDSLDYSCDHLMIIDKRTEKTVGTYRLNSGLNSTSFYCETEFQMESLLGMPGRKLELGRACIDRENRNGVVIALLWRGIVDYIRKTQTEILFGCGSIKIMDPLKVGLLTKHFIETGVLTYEYGVKPTRKYKVRQLERVLQYLDRNPYEYRKEEVALLIPSLFNSYLKMGAKLCGEPAIDRPFHCIDFLTYIRMDQMNLSFRERFGA